MDFPLEIWFAVLERLDTVSFVRLYQSGGISWALHSPHFQVQYQKRKEDYAMAKMVKNLRAIGEMASRLGPTLGLDLTGFGEVLAGQAPRFKTLYRDIMAKRS